MTHLIENAAAIAAQIAAMEEIESASVWTKVPGKERIYIEVIRADRDGNRFGGSGGKCWIDLHSGAVVAGKDGYNGSFYFNSFTKDFHEDHETVAKIKEIIALVS